MKFWAAFLASCAGTRANIRTVSTFGQLYRTRLCTGSLGLSLGLERLKARNCLLSCWRTTNATVSALIEVSCSTTLCRGNMAAAVGMVQIVETIGIGTEMMHQASANPSPWLSPPPNFPSPTLWGDSPWRSRSRTACFWLGMVTGLQHYGLLHRPSCVYACTSEVVPLPAAVVTILLLLLSTYLVQRSCKRTRTSWCGVHTVGPSVQVHTQVLITALYTAKPALVATSKGVLAFDLPTALLTTQWYTQVTLDPRRACYVYTPGLPSPECFSDKTMACPLARAAEFSAPSAAHARSATTSRHHVVAPLRRPCHRASFAQNHCRTFCSSPIFTCTLTCRRQVRKLTQVGQWKGAFRHQG